MKQSCLDLVLVFFVSSLYGWFHSCSSSLSMCSTSNLAHYNAFTFFLHSSSISCSLKNLVLQHVKVPTSSFKVHLGEDNIDSHDHYITSCQPTPR
jgi:hypothetical protein